MKIIHTSGLHLDSSLDFITNSVIQRERKREINQNLVRLIDYAKQNNADRIIISGGLFGTAPVSLKAITFFLEMVGENPDIDFIVIPSAKEDESDLASRASKYPNLKVFGNGFGVLHYADCDVTCVGYMDNYDFDCLDLKEDKVNILVLTGTVGDNINLSDLKNRNVDYLALGGNHEYSKGKLDKRGNYANSGCLDGACFSETGKKGFILLDIGESSVIPEFIPFSERTIHQVILNITDIDTYQEIRKNLNLKLNDIEHEDIVLVRLTGTYSLDLIKQNEMLEEALNDRFYYVKISDESKLKINPKDYENDISLKGEFIRNVLASDMDEEDKNDVIEYGIKALLKEDLN